MILYIGGFLIENVSKNIAQTKQVNTIGSLETRQTNYTNTGTFPRTANNVRAMNKLGVVGNDSNIPYQKNSCYLYSDTGECFVYDGWCIISETAKDYKFNIYDGVLELFKSIENIPLSSLNISALKHDKTLANVLATFDDSKPYKYIIADYNGKCVYDIDKINIDYLVPSVRASFLMEQIENYSGFALNGLYKTNPDFLNLWVTYPKGMVTELTTTPLLHSANLKQDNYPYVKALTTDVFTASITSPDNQNFTAVEDFFMAITISSAWMFTAMDRWSEYYYCEGSLYISVNEVSTFIGFVGGGNTLATITNQLNIQLSQGDVFYFYVANDIEEAPQNYTGSFSEITLSEYDSLNIDFVNELSGFFATDFLKEILWQFGLTMFKEKYSDVYTLKQLPEIIDLDNAIPYDNKFSNVEGEKYIFEQYCQKNVFAYQYNQDKSFYNNGSLQVNNVNLDAVKTVIQSKMFSPDEFKSNSLGVLSNVYRLWDKENKDDGTVIYKPKANHFYFLRSQNQTIASRGIGSETIGTSAFITEAPFESFTGLKWQDLVNKNYSRMRDILTKSKLLTVSLYLTSNDVSNVDFSRLVFIKELGAYFILNKVPNFVPNVKTKCELIRITPNSQTAITTGDFAPEDFSQTDFFTT